MTAAVAFTVGAQPVITPSSLSNRNAAGPDFPFWLTTNPAVALNTVPVGVPVPVPEAEGIVTMRL